MAENRKPIAPPASRIASGVGVAGTRDAVGEVHEAEDAAADRAPADDLAADRAVAVGVAQRAPGDDDEQDRDGPGQEADGSGGRRRGRSCRPGRACRTTPTPATTMPRPRRREAHAVTALLGIEVAGAVADAAGDRAHQPGDAEPQGRRGAQQRGEDNSKGTRPGLLRCGGLAGCRLAGLWLALARGGLLAGLAAGRPLARRGSRSGRHGQRLKHRSKVWPAGTPGAGRRVAVGQERLDGGGRGSGSAPNGRPARPGAPGRATRLTRPRVGRSAVEQGRGHDVGARPRSRRRPRRA